jgi:hypothetical protein
MQILLVLVSVGTKIETKTNKICTFRDVFATKNIQGLKQKIHEHT